MYHFQLVLAIWIHPILPTEYPFMHCGVSEFSKDPGIVFLDSFAARGQICLD